MVDIGDWMTRLAGWGLPGATALPPVPAPMAGLLAPVRGEKLTGVLAAAAAAGDVDVTDTDRELLLTAHRDAMAEVLLLEDVLLDAVDLLDRAGVAHRVLKGSALAHLVHPDPAQRCFGDVDLLVEGRHVGRAVDAFVAAGACRVQPQLSPVFDERFAKSVTLRWQRSVEIDLHRTLAPGPYGLLLRVDDLRSSPVRFELAGRALDTLPVDMHLVHGALHAALGDVEPRLGNLRDLALMLTRPGLDVDHVIGTARRWRCEAPVAEGLAAVEDLVGLVPLVKWAVHFVPSPDDVRLLAGYREREGRFRRQAMSSMRVLSTWSDRAAYLRSVARIPTRLRGRSR